MSGLYTVLTNTTYDLKTSVVLWESASHYLDQSLPSFLLLPKILKIETGSGMDGWVDGGWVGRIF
jgi:hypothetical protein